MKEYIERGKVLAEIDKAFKLFEEHGDIIRLFSDVRCSAIYAPAADVAERDDPARVQAAHDKVGQALDVAGAFYAQGYHDAMTAHNLVERKRGEWIKGKGNVWACSCCDAETAAPPCETPLDEGEYYCYYCGADMRGE